MESKIKLFLKWLVKCKSGQKKYCKDSVVVNSEHLFKVLGEARSRMFTFIASVVTHSNLARTEESPHPRHGNWGSAKHSDLLKVPQVTADVLGLESKSLWLQAQCSVLETVRWWSGGRSWGRRRWREGGLGKAIWSFTLICSGQAVTGTAIHFGDKETEAWRRAVTC